MGPDLGRRIEGGGTTSPGRGGCGVCVGEKVGTEEVRRGKVGGRAL